MAQHSAVLYVLLNYSTGHSNNCDCDHCIAWQASLAGNSQDPLLRQLPQASVMASLAPS